ncbi:MAG TPA: GyrI-like domain-containing protein [Bryobacteraceae bacterium]|nr:GyrI-like domain-containing protein [Bryobacteraceae bacterium]
MVTAVDLEFTEVKVAPALAVQMSGKCPPDPAAIGPAVRSAFESLMSFVHRRALAPNGPPRTIYTAHGRDGVSFIVAMPVAAGPVKPFDEPHLKVETLPGMKAYRFTHHGPYAGLGSTYEHITEFMIQKRWMKSQADWNRYMPMWEEYLNNPETTPAAELKTYIYLPAA